MSAAAVWLPLVALLIGAYLSGSIPAAYIVTRLLRGVDIRTTGSGTSGSTNALRLLGWKGALPVFIFDFLKGFVPVWFTLHTVINFGLPPMLVAVLVASASFVGHVYPVYIGFRGGKGVATGAGSLTALYPPLAPACLAVFIVILILTRRVSAASIAASLGVPLWYAAITVFIGKPIDPILLTFTVVMALGVLVTHRNNIRNLFAGSESRIF